jgi:tryptophan synthase alpha chain
MSATRRIATTFAALRKRRRTAFIPYITAGDPGLEQTVQLASALRRAGADLLELGVPFSDPIADGPANQRAAERALAAGTTLAGVLECVREIRMREQLPIVLFTYSNPLLRYGIDRFAEHAADAGVDGVLMTDVPVEEIDRFTGPFLGSRLDPIMLVAPTSTRVRARAAASAGRGFLYLIARTGITGSTEALEAELDERIRATRKLAKLPVAVGFGISTPEQVQQVATRADGVVVGSAIVREIGRIGASSELAARIEAHARPLAEACHGPRTR